MIEEVENLKKLVLEGGFDKESEQLVDDLRIKVQTTIAAENLKQHPVIVQVVDYLKAEIERCTTVLAHDRKQTEIQRAILFEKRELCKQLLAFFSPYDMNKLEEEIKSLLDVARHQS